MDFKNKVVVITGASSGIGEATALKFAKKGANVVLVARRKEKLLEVEKKISQEKKKAGGAAKKYANHLKSRK